VARYGQRYKDRIVARLLPPESSAIDVVSREMGVSVATLERWRADALADGSGERSGAGSQRWTAAARLQAVIAAPAMDEATRSAWCREQGLYRCGTRNTRFLRLMESPKISDMIHKPA
jgi:transposase